MSDNSPKLRRSVNEKLTIFLVATITLFATGTITYGIAIGSIQFTGSIDTTQIVTVVVLTGFVVILRFIFGKQNVDK